MKEFVFVSFFLLVATEDVFQVNILHTANLHSQFLPTPFGNGTRFGIARMIAYVNQQKNQSNIPTLYFDTLDCAVGGTWYNIFGLEVCADFVRLLPVDAVSMGEAEMLGGKSGQREKDFKRFLEHINKTVICTNCMVQDDEDFDNLISSSYIIPAGKRKIGVVGYLDVTLSPTPFGKVKFLPEIPALREEISMLKQDEVDIIIALGHGSLKLDEEIAVACEGINLIIGGHSFTFFYSGNPPVPQPNTYPEYPKEIQNMDGGQVLLVHSGIYGHYVGNIHLAFKDDGSILYGMGNPVLMDTSYPEDAVALQLVEEYKNRIATEDKVLIGRTRVKLEGNCAWKECNLGNLITDAYVDFSVSRYNHPAHWADTSIALINNGAIKSDVKLGRNKYIGSITSAHLHDVMPFIDFLVCLQLQGKDLRRALEYSVIDDKDDNSAKFLQVSGIHVVYDMMKAHYQRIVSVKVRCSSCETPHYVDLADGRHYNILVAHSLVSGGEGFHMLYNKSIKVHFEYITNAEIVQEYIIKHKYIQIGNEERVIVLNREGSTPNRTTKIDLLPYLFVVASFTIKYF